MVVFIKKANLKYIDIFNKKTYSKATIYLFARYQIIDLDIQKILIDKLSYIQTQPGFQGTLKVGPFKQAIFAYIFKAKMIKTFVQVILMSGIKL